MVKFFNTLIGFLFPGRCRACGALIRDASNPYICPACWSALRFPEGKLCPRCGAELGGREGESQVCDPCEAGENLFDKGLWVCGYNEAMRSAIHTLKYERKSRMARFLSDLMVSSIGEFMEEAKAEVLLPVPIHRKKLREREFNQASLLAKGIGKVYNIPVVEGCLVRDRETPPQSQLDREGRRSNVRGAFKVADAKKVSGKSVMLVDDIYTTGATANECCRVLIEAGVRSVYVLTLARPVAL
jgi:ComF family protein